LVDAASGVGFAEFVCERLVSPSPKEGGLSF